MIPEKIQLRNFMCYRDDLPPLELDGIQIACLSGENGAGKSALLDAITWALWGKARISSDDELIALGEHEMEVDLQFALAGTRYRVKRHRSSAKRGQTMLDIQAESPSGWRSLTGNSVRETQAIISDLLRMEYDTFINSAFLVQGKADEFTRKAPADRKRVLAEILGLAEYERLEARAKEQAKELGDRIKGMEALLEEFRRQVERRDFYLTEEAGASARVETLSAEVAAANAELEQAAERRRSLEARRDKRDSEQSRLNELLEALAATRRDAEELNREVAVEREIVGRRAEIEAGVAGLAAARAELARLDELREQAVAIRDEIHVVRDAVSDARRKLESRWERANSETGRLEALVSKRDTVQSEQTQVAERLQALDADGWHLTDLRTRRETLEEQGRTLASLQVEVQRLKGQIDVALDSRIAAREEQSRRISEYDSQLRDEERWREELATATAQQRALQRDERRLGELRALDQADGERLGELRARSNAIEGQGKQIREKLALLQHGGDTTCPLCKSEIGHRGIADIERSYTADREQLLAGFREAKREADMLEIALDARRREMLALERKVTELPAIAARIARLEGQLREAEDARARRAETQATLLTLEAQIRDHDFAHDERAALSRVERDIRALGVDQPALESQRREIAAQIAAYEQQLAERGKIEGRAQVLATHLASIEAAEQELAAVRDEALRLRVQLDSDDFLPEEQGRLAELKRRMESLGYGTNAHGEARASAENLAFWEEQGHLLRGAAAHLESNERNLQRLRATIQRDEAESEQLRTTIAELAVEVAMLAPAIGAVEAAARAVESGRLRLSVAQRELGAVQQQLHSVEQIAEQLLEKEKDYAALLDEHNVYLELAKAFGKKGIQAMLIETAIPELERESNALLGRMTDNQMHLSFETQRETKKGDTSETLDIQIADAQGTRRYDLYSGGEAFRINFAIRIALSKLLARRAGANLQTLIIDEGFGSQDGRGRERLVEAINFIQSEFARILVITHIQELKDQFPVQIEITKTDMGS
ncbi:MAG TPA: AAA family ATPase, partial [Herpetosiphonaceae bacterium]